LFQVKKSSGVFSCNSNIDEESLGYDYLQYKIKPGEIAQLEQFNNYA